MNTRRLVWQLFSPLWLFVLLVLLAATILLSRTFKDFYYAQTEQDLSSRTRFVEKLLEQPITEGDYSKVDSLCKALGAASGTRLTAILPSGKVIGDSREDPAAMDNHEFRPEIVHAKSSGIGTARRHSYTLYSDFMYVAKTLTQNDSLVAYVRTSISVVSIDAALGMVYFEIALGAVAVTALVFLSSLVISRRLSSQLVDMGEMARRFAAGELSHRLPQRKIREIDELSRALNDMASRLEDRIQTVIKQRSEQEAVFASMVEGVIAFDSEERLIDLNVAAEKMLGIDANRQKGRYLHEIARSPYLQDFVARALKSVEPIETELPLRASSIQSTEEKFFQAHGAVLRDSDGNRIGVVVVLNDVTRLKRLENLRRDFVANVSHELKTPITAIKGFVETLLDGALNDQDNARRFLEIIIKHSDRLNSIIDDLLLLSRLESGADMPAVRLSDENLKDTIGDSLKLLTDAATARNIRIVTACDPLLIARIDRELLQEAIINLVDNAIRYSHEGTIVSIGVQKKGGEVQIEVADTGPGIPQEHLTRLFERFYRVDANRSRRLGGTGLGLAIVKHIAIAHGGNVSVESVVGKGSIFRIHLPDRA